MLKAFDYWLLAFGFWPLAFGCTLSIHQDDRAAQAAGEDDI
jgi:hypothetical protein